MNIKLRFAWFKTHEQVFFPLKKLFPVIENISQESGFTVIGFHKKCDSINLKIVQI